MAESIVENIADKVEKGIRLSREDGIALMESNDLISIGRLANMVKERKSGAVAYFNVNRHINLTNVCVSRCAFCAFSRDKGDADAYTLSLDDVLRVARAARHDGVTEFHIVSGLHPDLPFSYYRDVIAALKEEMPDVHLKAFTAVEIFYFSQLTGFGVEDVLRELQMAGLGSLPGGGAEILHPRVRQRVCPNKASSSEWLDVMRTAHRLGLKSNATMLYGHVETSSERVDHLLALRALQDETGGFQAFIPLPFHPRNTRLSHMRRPTAVEKLKVLAVSRLMLDNVPHIKAYWVMHGVKVAQLALLFGADDLDGTVAEEKITYSAGAETVQSLSRDELCDLIRSAGRVPVERDSLYRLVGDVRKDQAGVRSET